MQGLALTQVEMDPASMWHWLVAVLQNKTPLQAF
jgi:hypothetical protein